VNTGPATARWGLFQTSLGWCAALWTPRGLSYLVLPRKNKVAAQRFLEIQSRMPGAFFEKSPFPVPEIIVQQTQKALSGHAILYQKLDLSALTPFQIKVLHATRRIPCGKTQSYGWISRHSGSPAGCRAAGQALKRNPVPLFVPCHRVIGCGNELGGFGAGIDWKIRLLQTEGVKIIRSREGSYRVQ
jgi:methylated-DNA-[protein]-cysteine S-methyltransferase